MRPLDRIILGDNPFFGINHMSEERAQAQAERFGNVREVIRFIDVAYECGIRAFMLNTHEAVAEICRHLRANPARYGGIRLYPSLPYAHKYANSVNEKGIIGALDEFLFAGRTTAQVLGALFRGGLSVVKRDPLEVMRLLVDSEMWMFRGLDVRVIFLQNIISDMLLGLGSKELFIEFGRHVTSKYDAEVGFITMNLPAMVTMLSSCGFENPIVCASINKIGYLMSPGIEPYERALREMPFRAVAMSVFASGAIPPEEAIRYVTQFHRVESIVFGASSPQNILRTMALIAAHRPAPTVHGGQRVTRAAETSPRHPSAGGVSESTRSLSDPHGHPSS